jgi:hypothetical protein
MLEQAAVILGCKLDVLQEFVDAKDEYNGNTLTGVLCQQGDHRYGALVIFKVNGKDVTPQRIYCTPKLHYPFGKDDELERHYHWPTIQRARVYEKLDGTNICAYSYADAMGERFVTFKTRLTPTLRASKWGDFKSMWDRMLAKYPRARCVAEVLAGSCALSFEMYGYQNPVLVHYDVDLDARLLFGIGRVDARISTPENFYLGMDCPMIQDVGSTAELTGAYEKLREEANKRNSKTEEGYIIGTEGFVFYTWDGLIWQMWKCKPEMIESLHWTKGGISRNAILTTAKNALENVSVEELTVEYVNGLLAEEFSVEQIGLSAARVAEAVEEVKAYWERCAKVKDLYSRCPDTGSKREVMRYMSRFFERGQMSVVYNTLKALGLVDCAAGN